MLHLYVIAVKATNIVHYFFSKILIMLAFYLCWFVQKDQ
jgi:hypothetical protein